jgi:hypothetical protein
VRRSFEAADPARRVRVLTWHVHGSYLAYLARCGHEIYLPVGRGDEDGYLGRTASFDWPDNVIEIDADQVRDLDLDVVLCQSRRNYEQDRFELLSARQRSLPHVYLEHDPPREHPTDTRHVVDDPRALLVHVTHFNRLMWDNGRTPTTVVEHGVAVPSQARYTGELERGLVVVNGLNWRGRRLGLDLFLEARRHLPLDLVGMHSRELGGLGEVSPRDLPAVMARYRFFYHPVRYTSLGLALLEAMSVGMPVVALATTEVVETVQDGVSGFTSTEPERLLEPMRRLLSDRAMALQMGLAARRTATTRYGIDRFARDWRRLLSEVSERRPGTVSSMAGGRA